MAGPDEIGTKLGISGEREYRDGMNAIVDALKLVSSETAKTSAAYDKNDKSAAALTARNEDLTKKLELQRQKVEECRKGLANANAEWGDASKRAVQWQKDLNHAEAAVIGTERAIRKNTDALAAMNQEASSKALKELAAGAKMAGENLGAAGNTLTMGLTVPLAAAGAASVNYASDTAEAVNKVEVAFGYAAEGVKSWSDTTLTSFGLAKGTALDMAALYGDMATSMGYNDAAAADMSKTLVGLAADLASFKNISVDVANTALKSIFTGETESLKNLGVVMTQANLQSYALSQGFKTAYTEMDQTEQVAVRLQYVLDKTANAQGDFARTSDGTANQLRIFQESLKEAASIAGDELLPIITPIIGKLSELIQSFGDLDEGTRKAVVQTGLFLAALGPSLKLVGGITTAAKAGATAYLSLTAAKAADTVATGAQTVATETATAAQIALNTAMKSNVIGFVITALGALVAGLVAFGAASALAGEGQEDLNQKMRATVKDADEAAERIRKDTAAKTENLAAVESLLPKIEELNQKTSRTSKEQHLLNGMVATANQLYPGLIGEVDALTGSYDLNTQSIGDNIEALKKRFEMEANQEIILEKYRAAADLKGQLVEAETQLAAATENLEKKQLAVNDAAVQFGKTPKEYEGMQAAVEGAAGQVSQAQKAVDELSAAIGKQESEAEALIGTNVELAQSVGELTEETGEAEEGVKGLGAAAEDTAKTISDLASGLDSAAKSFSDITDAQGIGTSAAIKLQQEYANLASEHSELLAQYPELYAALSANNTVQENSAEIARSVWGIRKQLLIEELEAQASNIRNQIHNLDTYKNAALDAYAAIAKAAALSTGDGGVGEQRAEQISGRRMQSALDGDKVYRDLIAQSNAIGAQIKDLQAVSIESYAASISSSSKSGGKGKKDKTGAELELEAYRAAVKELDHARAMEEISEEEYYRKKEAVGALYLGNNLEEAKKLEEELYTYHKGAYERELAELDKALKYQEISREEHGKRVAELGEEHLKKDSDAWKENQAIQAADRAAAYEEKISALDQALEDEKISHEQHLSGLQALENEAQSVSETAFRDNQKRQAQSRKSAYEDELADHRFFLDMGIISEKEYYAEVRRLRDEHFEENSEEWRRATVEIHQYEERMLKEALDALKEALDERLSTLKDAYSEEITAIKDTYDAEKDALKETYDAQKTAAKEAYDAQKTAAKEAYNAKKDAIKKELDLEKERVNGILDGIDAEIQARRELREDEDLDGAVAAAQRKLDAARAAQAFARTDEDKQSFANEVTRMEKALQEAIEKKEDTEFYRQKELEKDAARGELDAAQEAADAKLDAASKDYEAETSKMEAEYSAKVKQMEAEYKTAVKRLEEDYKAKLAAAEAAYKAAVKRLEADYERDKAGAGSGGGGSKPDDRYNQTEWSDEVRAIARENGVDLGVAQDMYNYNQQHKGDPDYKPYSSGERTQKVADSAARMMGAVMDKVATSIISNTQNITRNNSANVTINSAPSLSTGQIRALTRKAMEEMDR